MKNLALVLLSLGLIASGAFLFWIANLKTPTLESFRDRRVSQSTKIYDRTGEVLLYEIHDEARRTVVPLGDISRHIKNATVAIEDSEFYEHSGVKLSAIVRAVVSNIGKFGLGDFGWGQGGSTITQQVVKNSILTSEKKVSRKIKEWILSLKLEKAYNKETILSYYLNESPYGGNLYGVEEASRAFFGKPASETTVAEAAYLAALPQAPTYYSPYGNHKDELEQRKNLVLKRMKDDSFINEEEYKNALAERVAFQKSEDVGIKAPHFVIYIKEYLEKKFGKSVIRDGGLKVTTTLNYALQEKAEELVKKYALENAEKFNAENAALVAIDPKTGDILTMVCSRDYFDEKIDGNFNVVLAKRQPGSAFKPFVYATAFKKGYLPETVVFDLKTEFSAYCNPDGTPIIPEDEDKCYQPENYDSVFRGPITLRDALAQSVNIPAVKTLYLAGLKDALQTANDMGISSLTDVNRYGLTLVLGGGEVSLLEMTGAYGVFATEGIRYPARSVLKVETASGKILEESSPSYSKVLPENVARLISDILSDEDARAPSFGRHSYLYFSDRQVAVKTGTTNDYRDAWILGYTPSVAVGAWAGNNDNRSMEKKVAGFIIAPLWHAFMEEVFKYYESEQFNKPEEISDAGIKPSIRGFWQGNETYKIDKISGKLATAFTPPELVQEKSLINIHSILHWVDKNAPLGPPPATPNNDPQYERWEWAVKNWAKANNFEEQNRSVIPTEYDAIHTPLNSPKISVLRPLAGASILAGSKLNVAISSSGAFPLSKVDIFINDKYISTLRRAPFETALSLDQIEDLKSKNSLVIVGYDSVLNKSEVSVDFGVAF